MAKEYSVEQLKKNAGVSEEVETKVLKQLGVTASEVGQLNVSDVLMLLIDFICAYSEPYIEEFEQLQESDIDVDTDSVAGNMASFAKHVKLGESGRIQECLLDILQTVMVLNFVHIGENCDGIVVLGENEDESDFVDDKTTNGFTLKRFEEIGRKIGISDESEKELLEKLGITKADIGQLDARGALGLICSCANAYGTLSDEQMEQFDKQCGTDVKSLEEKNNMIHEAIGAKKCILALIEWATMLTYMYVDENKANYIADVS